MSVELERDLFGDVIQPVYKTGVIPVSVLDVVPQKVRTGNHDRESSRAEFSPFPKEVASLCFEFFMRDAALVFDPFAGWGERGEAAAAFGRRYIGYDISPDAVASAAARGVANRLCDSRVAPIPRHDGVVTCPPYWNLETYAGAGLDKCPDWEQFKIDLAHVFCRCWSQAARGAVYCVMVGEWRRDHRFYDLEGVVRRIFDNLGAEMFDQITVSRKNVSKIKVMLPQAKRLGYSVRVHESLLVFKKTNDNSQS